MTGTNYREILTTDKPLKSLTIGFSRGSGRNAFGRITTRHKGGGHKRSFREIDWKYDKLDIPAKVQSVEYDPNRSGFIGLVAYRDGHKAYTLLPKSMKVGDTLYVDAGTYAEQVTIDKGITMLGAGQNLSFIIRDTTVPLANAPGFVEKGLIQSTQNIGDIHRDIQGM